MTAFDIGLTRRFDWIRYHASCSPDKVALVDPHRETMTSYGSLDSRVDRGSACLQLLGVRPKDRVILVSANRPEVIEIALACWRVGASFVPLNWRLAERELIEIVRDADPVVLLCDAEHHEVASRICAAVELSQPRVFSYTDDWIGGTTLSNEAPHEANLEEIATLLYTSGTTGKPKGVVVTHAMIFWHALNISGTAAIDSGARQLVLLPLFHTGGLNLYVNPVLYAGGTLVLPRRFDAPDALNWLRDSNAGISHVFGVPTMYEQMARLPEFESSDFSHLSIAGVGGASCSKDTIIKWSKHGAPLVQGWGMTECGPSGSVLDTADAVLRAGSVGRPLRHIDLRLVDRSGVDVSVGEVGEIWARGPSITPGYWQNDSATEAAFVDGWFRTGDAARYDDEGYLEIVDRWKDMYISGGENVYPAEVESVLHQMEGVSDCAVIGVPDSTWGEVGLACIVSPFALDDEAVLQECRKHLAPYKVPKRVLILDELPRNATGKVLKFELREIEARLQGAEGADSCD